MHRLIYALGLIDASMLGALVVLTIAVVASAPRLR